MLYHRRTRVRRRAERSSRVPGSSRRCFVSRPPKYGSSNADQANYYTPSSSTSYSILPDLHEGVKVSVLQVIAPITRRFPPVRRYDPVMRRFSELFKDESHCPAAKERGGIANWRNVGLFRSRQLAGIE